MCVDPISGPVTSAASSTSPKPVSVTMVLSTHDLNLAAALCRHLILLRGGRVIAQGPTEAVLTPEAVRALYGVEADVQRHPAAGHLTVTPIARVP